MRKIAFILLSLACLNIFSQSRLAIIEDKDGYINIREEKGTQSPIIEKLKSGEFVYCEKSSSEWYPILALKWHPIGNHYGELIKGFCHKSGIKIIEELPIDSQKVIISKVLNNYKKIVDEENRIFSESNKGKFDNKTDSTKAYNFSSKRAALVDTQYDPILMYLPKYYCKTKDIEILTLLISVVCSDKGTCNEQPSYTLGECYICNDKQFIILLNNCTNKELLDLLIDDAKWGLANIFNIDPESSQITNKEYLRLTKQIESIRISNH